MGRSDIKPLLALFSSVALSNGWQVRLRVERSRGKCHCDCDPVYHACLFASCMILLIGMGHSGDCLGPVWRVTVTS